MVDALAKGRRLAAGLPVLAMPDEAREAMLQRVTTRAHQVLPTVEQVLLAVEEDDDDRPAISPLAVVLAIAIALILGVAVAALTRAGTTGSSTPTALPTGVPGPITPSFTVSPTPSVSTSPSRSVSATPTRSTTPSASVTATHSSVVVNPAVTVSPVQGPQGTSIIVSGTGWQPGDAVTVRYTGPVSSSHTSATADARGRFTVTVTASGLVPGDYQIQASGSSGTASASFRQTS